MKRLLQLLPFALMAVGCDDKPPPPPPPTPPQVFITVLESNVIGGQVRGRVNVSGCTSIAGLELLEQDNFLVNIGNPDGGTRTPVDFALSPGSFSHLYGQRGIATSLTLKAKVTCNDARTNNSQPVGVKFFPISSRVTSTTPGEQAVPDSFIAEGGIGGTQVTFLGCALTSTGGTTLARVNASGQLVGFAGAIPFDCNGSTIITEKSQVTGTRWVLQPGVGVYSINQNLDIGRQRAGKAARIGVGKNGSAVVWFDEEATMQRVEKLDPLPGSSNEWAYQTGGIMNSTPIIDEGANVVMFSQWYDEIGTTKSQTLVFKLNYLTGALLNPYPGSQQPPVLYQQMHSSDPIDVKIKPEGTFNANGSLFTLPLMSNAGGVLSTTIVSCPTDGPLCGPGNMRWSSPTLPTRLAQVVPFSQGNILAAIGPYAVYFLNTQTGAVTNLGEVPLVPAGSNIVLDVQPGLDTDFYVLTGPNFGDNVPSYANEIIAVDSPQAGELWRVEYGSGENYLNGMTIGIDEAKTVWMRVGTDLVKPLSNAEYRTARGPTRLP
ncbi:MAG: hypothetical protein DI536_04800 [Archangium gephyra]|uniref:Lipoprotein n=1 Tax=Archangium gephyra TaxID=48 RepID=A0A2W5TWF8_9BACT|nr:MAG: hypothetical protein DI536_04800 [Archangium gephyra]